MKRLLTIAVLGTCLFLCICAALCTFLVSRDHFQTTSISSPKADSQLSLTLLEKPIAEEQISRIVIYRTDKSGWLGTPGVASPPPVAVLSDPVEINKLCTVLENGLITPGADSNLAWPSSYQMQAWHILAYDSSGLRYGYLQVRFNAAPNPDTVAEVRPLCEANPVYYYRGLPQYLLQLK